MHGRVLVIEDDAKIARLVQIHLRDLGLEPEWVSEGREAIRRATTERFALIVLDLMLPDIDGLEVCKRLRAANASLPILMLTARSDELDVVLGLELGADEYITKPFSIREFVARVKALFRRIEADIDEKAVGRQGGAVDFGRLHIDRDRRKVTLDGELVDLTAKEFDLLTFFASSPGTVFTRGQLLEHVWGYRFEGYDHTVNSLINRLRRKIEPDASPPRFIKTVWGVGYRFCEPDEVE